MHAFMNCFFMIDQMYSTSSDVKQESKSNSNSPSRLAFGKSNTNLGLMEGKTNLAVS